MITNKGSAFYPIMQVRIFSEVFFFFSKFTLINQFDLLTRTLLDNGLALPHSYEVLHRSSDAMQPASIWDPEEHHILGNNNNVKTT